MHKKEKARGFPSLSIQNQEVAEGQIIQIFQIEARKAMKFIQLVLEGIAVHKEFLGGLHQIGLGGPHGLDDVRHVFTVIDVVADFFWNNT